MKPNTQKAYSSGQKLYFEFCYKYNYQPLPATENIMLMFVTYMYTKSYRSQTIRSYLSSVRSIHMDEGYSNPSEQSYCIKQALKAIQRSEDKPMKSFQLHMKYYVNDWQSLMSDMSQFSADKNLVNEDVQFHSTEKNKVINT